MMNDNIEITEMESVRAKIFLVGDRGTTIVVMERKTDG